MFWDEALGKEENEARARKLWETSRFKEQVGVVHLALASVRVPPLTTVTSSSGSPDTDDACTATAGSSVGPPGGQTPQVQFPPLPRALLEVQQATTLAASLEALSLVRRTSTSSPAVPLSTKASHPPFSRLLPPLLAFITPAAPGEPKPLKPPASLTPHTIEALLFGARHSMTTMYVLTFCLLPPFFFFLRRR